MAVGKSPATTPSRYGRVGATKSNTPRASFEDADADQLWRTITAVVNAGDYIAFSRTRDGGAVCIMVRSEEETVKEYATGPEEIASLLADIRASVEDAV